MASETSTSLARVQDALAGRYRIHEEVGRGGMAILYRAFDARHSRDVAIKILRPDFANIVNWERFSREIHVTSRLVHPNIVPVFDSGEADGLVYYVMPFISGESLKDLLAREPQLQVSEALSIVGEIGDALIHAHSYGLIHRDIKPANILLSGGHAFLADFGIAHAVTEIGGERLTESGIAVGTPAYMSPEQAAGDPHVGIASDLYSLACVLYEMLVGEPPFSGPNVQALLARHMQERPPSIEVVRPNMPSGIIDVVEQALEKVPADRFRTVAVFLAALDRAKDTEPVRRVLRRRRIRNFAIAGAVASVLALGALLILPGAVPLDPNKVAVYPLVERGLPPEERGAGYDVAIMISAAFDHADPLRWEDMRPRLSEAIREDIGRLGAADAARIARSTGARYYVDGVVRAGRDSITVFVRLHDAAGDSLVKQSTESAPARTVPYHRLGLAAVTQLLPVLLDPGRDIDLTPLLDRAHGAVALWIQGERAYRRSQFDSAAELHLRALEADSLLAMAALRGAGAANWAGDFARAESLMTVALSRQTFLPTRYLPFARGLHAYLSGEADNAVSWLEHALRTAPTWSEARVVLGEVYYHLLPSGSGPLDSLAEAAFAAAQATDSGFSPPIVHLAEIAIRSGAFERAEDLIELLRSFKPGEELLGQLDVMLACAKDGRPAGGWEAVLDDDPLLVLRAAKSLATAGAYLDCSEAGYHALLGSDAPANHRNGAFYGLHAVLIARGRYTEAQQLVDSVVRAGRPIEMTHFILDYLAGADADSASRELVAFLQRVRGDDYTQLKHPMTLWLLACWHASLGDAVIVNRIARQLARLAESTSDPADSTYANSAKAAAALAMGDSGGAIDAFRRLRIVARRNAVDWDLGMSHAPERLWLAQLECERGRYEEALLIASGFDHPGPVIYLAFLPASLVIRYQAAAALGRTDEARRLRGRLGTLGRGSMLDSLVAAGVRPRSLPHRGPLPRCAWRSGA